MPYMKCREDVEKNSGTWRFKAIANELKKLWEKLNFPFIEEKSIVRNVDIIINQSVDIDVESTENDTHDADYCPDDADDSEASVL